MRCARSHQVWHVIAFRLDVGQTAYDEGATKERAGTTLCGLRSELVAAPVRVQHAANARLTIAASARTWLMVCFQAFVMALP